MTTPLTDQELAFIIVLVVGSLIAIFWRRK